MATHHPPVSITDDGIVLVSIPDTGTHPEQRRKAILIVRRLWMARAKLNFRHGYEVQSWFALMIWGRLGTELDDAEQ